MSVFSGIIDAVADLLNSGLDLGVNVGQSHIAVGDAIFVVGVGLGVYLLYKKIKAADIKK